MKSEQTAILCPERSKCAPVLSVINGFIFGHGVVIYYLLDTLHLHPKWLQRGGSSVGCASAWHTDGRRFDPRVRQHSFVEIGHEITSTTIRILLLIQAGQLSVTGERMCTLHLVLVYRYGSLSRNCVVRLTDRLDMTIIVDWDVKWQIKQTNCVFGQPSKVILSIPPSQPHPTPLTWLQTTS